MDRRKFAKSLGGGALALPLLPSVFKANLAKAAEADIAKKKYFIFCHYPMGASRDIVFPEGALPQNTADLHPRLQMLGDFKRDLLYVSNIQNPSIFTGPAPIAAAHGSALVSLMTGSALQRWDANQVDQLPAGRSIDYQILDAMKLPEDRIFRLGTEKFFGGADNAPWYYGSETSWLNSTTPLQNDRNPRAIFDRFFLKNSLSPEEQARVCARKSSALDLASDQLDKLAKRASGIDRQRLDQYLTYFRQLEQSVCGSGDALTLSMTRPNALPTELPFDVVKVRERTRNMFQLMYQGMSCGIAPVCTLTFGVSGSPVSYTELGVYAAHHSLTHDDNANYVVLLNTIWDFYMSELALFLGRLRDTVEPDGKTMLEKAVVLVAGDMQSGFTHEINRIPLFMIGHGHGIPTGRHIALQTATPVGYLYNTLLQKFGKEGDPKFGLYSGALALV